MARNPMQMLQKVRRQAVEQARHALARCLAAEAAIGDRLRAMNEAGERDRVANRTVVDAYLFTEMFSQRLQLVAAGRLSAEAELMSARATSTDARAALIAARMAEEAVETLIVQRTEAVDAIARRSEQHALDDIARTRFDTPIR